MVIFAEPFKGKLTFPAVKSVFDKFPGRLASALRATWGQLFEAFSQGSSGMLDGRYFQNPLNPKKSLVFG